MSKKPQCFLLDGKPDLCRSVISRAYELASNTRTVAQKQQHTVVDILEQSYRKTDYGKILKYLKIPIQVDSMSGYKSSSTFGSFKYHHFMLLCDMYWKNNRSPISFEFSNSPNYNRLVNSRTDFIVFSQKQSVNYVRVNEGNNTSWENWRYFYPGVNPPKNPIIGTRINHRGVHSPSAGESYLLVCTFIHFHQKYQQEYKNRNVFTIEESDVKYVFDKYFAPYTNGMSSRGISNSSFNFPSDNYSSTMRYDPLNVPRNRFDNYQSFDRYPLQYNNYSQYGRDGYSRDKRSDPVVDISSNNIPNDLSIVDMQYILYYIFRRMPDERKHARFHRVVNKFFDSKRRDTNAVEWKSSIDKSLKEIKSSTSDSKFIYYETWDQLYNIFKTSDINKWSMDASQYQKLVLNITDQLIDKYKRKNGQSDVSRSIFTKVPVKMQAYLSKTAGFSSPQALYTYDYKFWLMEILRINAVREGIENTNLKRFEIRSLELLSWDFKSNSNEDIVEFKQTFNKCTSLFDEIDEFLEKHMIDIRENIEDVKAAETKSAPKRLRRDQSFSVEISREQRMLADEMMKRLEKDVKEKKFFIEQKQNNQYEIKPYYFPQTFNRNVEIFHNAFDYENWINGVEFTPTQLEYYSYSFDNFVVYLYAMLFVISKIHAMDDLERGSEMIRIIVLLIQSLYQFFQATQKNDDNHEAVCYVLQILKNVLYDDESGYMKKQQENVNDQSTYRDLLQLKDFFERVEVSCFDEASNAERVANRNPLIQRVKRLIVDMRD